MAQCNAKRHDVTANEDSKTAPLTTYNHSIVYSVSLITADSMLVAHVCVCDVMPFAITQHHAALLMLSQVHDKPAH